MAYFVIGDDGQKYGPADVPTLNQWISENRLLRTQILEDEASGARMAASAVEGLRFPPQAPPPGTTAGPLPGAPGFQGQYPRAGGYVADDGSSDVRNAWIFFVAGLICCALLHIGAIVSGNNAVAKGNSGGSAPKIASIIFLVIQLIGAVIYGYAAFRGMNAMSQPPLQGNPFTPAH